MGAQKKVGGRRRAVLALCLGTALLLAAVWIWQNRQPLPVLMYHNLTQDEAAVNSMTITVDRFREDMEYLAAQGYQALLPAELCALREQGAPLPEKPVLITFDDGYVSNYTYALPILEETGMKAVVSLIVGKMGDAPGEVFLSWEQCRALARSEAVELGCHTWALHNEDNGGLPHADGRDGVQRLAGESRQAYDERVGSDLRRALEAIERETGQTCVYFSYPFGATDSWFDRLLDATGVQVTATTNQREGYVRFGLRGLPRWRVTMQRPLSSML